MEPQCVKSRAAWNYLWLTSDYMSEVFFLNVFSQTLRLRLFSWKRMYALQNSPCFTRKTWWQCHFQGNGFIFERTTSSSRHVGNSLTTCENYDELCELWGLYKMEDNLNCVRSFWLLPDMMSNKYNSLQNLSENKFDHMSKTSSWLHITRPHATVTKHTRHKFQCKHKHFVCVWLLILHLT